MPSDLETILLEREKLNGEDFNLLYNLAYVYHHTNHIDRAILYYEKALQNADNKVNADEVYKILEILK